MADLSRQLGLLQKKARKFLRSFEDQLGALMPPFDSHNAHGRRKERRRIDVVTDRGVGLLRLALLARKDIRRTDIGKLDAAKRRHAASRRLADRKNGNVIDVKQNVVLIDRSNEFRI